MDPSAIHISLYAHKIAILGLYWLVVLTILKNIRQREGLSHILWKIKHVPNHHPVIYGKYVNIFFIYPNMTNANGTIPCFKFDQGH